MADDVIKSFLVRIGYKHDEVALKRITEGIGNATKAVFSFGAAIAATATAVAWGVSRIASNLETLYFASIRTGNSASSLEAFEFAARRMGAQAGSGLASVEALAAFFRNLPPGMGANAIKTWFPGADVNDKDPVQTLVELGNAMQKMDYYQAKMRGNAIGLSDEQVWFLRQPGLGKMYGQMKQALGPNFERATEDAHRFENSLALLEIRLEGFGAVVLDVLERKFGWSLDRLATWLDKNGDTFATRLGNGLETFLGYLQKLEPKLEWLLDKLVDLDHKTNGWSTIIIGLSAVMPGLVTGVISLGGALAGLAVGGAAKGIGLLLSLGARFLAPLGAAYGGYKLGEWIDEKFPNNPLARIGDYIGNKIYDYTHQKEHAMQVLSNFGFNRSQAAGIVANLNAESALQPNESGDNGQAYGIAQWHKAGQDRFKQMFGFDIQDSNIDQQLRFLANDIRAGGANENVGRALRNTNAMQSGQIFSRLYERPAAGESEANRRGAAAVELEHNTTVQINGAQEPHEVARQVANAQERTARVSAAIIREFASNVQ